MLVGIVTVNCTCGERFTRKLFPGQPAVTCKCGLTRPVWHDGRCCRDVTERVYDVGTCAQCGEQAVFPRLAEGETFSLCCRGCDCVIKFRKVGRTATCVHIDPCSA